ncbi:hypothetical protein ALC56_08354 [Trachymyrmex septentrionalis]|uniref:Uncharacterized protein n=1 Tax=Trachymyrmex septentrionalis TaxID=34720 RepID=A0A195FAQ8_9HYME|nr:hypothetical protein ALC56_08354 [Trachymyrmex septentrionalis]
MTVRRCDGKVVEEKEEEEEEEEEERRWGENLRRFHAWRATAERLSHPRRPLLLPSSCRLRGGDGRRGEVETLVGSFGQPFLDLNVRVPTSFTAPRTTAAAAAAAAAATTTTTITATATATATVGRCQRINDVAPEDSKKVRRGRLNSRRKLRRGAPPRRSVSFRGDRSAGVSIAVRRRNAEEGIISRRERSRGAKIDHVVMVSPSGTERKRDREPEREQDRDARGRGGGRERERERVRWRDEDSRVASGTWRESRVKEGADGRLNTFERERPPPLSPPVPPAGEIERNVYRTELETCDTEGRTVERIWADDRVREGTHNRPAPGGETERGKKNEGNECAGCLGGRDRETREKRTSRRRRRRDACAVRVETKCTGIHVYIGGTRDAEGSQRGQRKARREGGRDGGKKRGREARRGEILTLEMRELPRVCGVRNFLTIYIDDGAAKGEKGARESEREREKARESKNESESESESERERERGRERERERARERNGERRRGS